MTTVLEISDSEGEDCDCVIESVIFLEDESKENYSDLYYEVCQENLLLAEFIEKCIRLENSKSMLQILKKQLLQRYYDADKSARESPKFQKNLQRAKYLLRIDPQHKFSHIKDLCNILQALKVKKKVPFITLSTNLEDKNNKSSNLKRKNNEQLDVASNSKMPKLDSNNISPFNETVSESSFHITTDTLDESVSMEPCSQQCSLEENHLLIEKKNNNVEQTTFIDNKIKVIEHKISYYNNKIAVLDKMEVDDDSIKSPYIKSERLKTKIVTLYKKLCELKGSPPVKQKGIRLKLADGHPPGPTRVLEKFLNTDLNHDGNLYFPDFCDVVTCVTEANNKDDLGWNTAQIREEASALFTLCGRALQKRRQYREYRDLMHRVKSENVEKDPAEDDPGLRAVLEKNKRIAIKKESDLLERFAKMQYLPSKEKTHKSSTNIKDTQEENVGEANVTDCSQKDIINDNNKRSSKHLVSENPVVKSGRKYQDEIEKKSADVPMECNKTIYNNKSNVNVGSQETLKPYHKSIENLNDTQPKTVDTEKRIPESIPLHNFDTKMVAAKHRHNDKGGYSEISYNNHKRTPVSKVKEIEKVSNSNYNNDKINDVVEKNKSIAIEHPIIGEKTIESPEQQKSQQNLMEMFERLGDNFTVTIEILSDS